LKVLPSYQSLTNQQCSSLPWYKKGMHTAVLLAFNAMHACGICNGRPGHIAATSKWQASPMVYSLRQQSTDRATCRSRCMGCCWQCCINARCACVKHGKLLSATEYTLWCLQALSQGCSARLHGWSCRLIPCLYRLHTHCVQQ
jgi:hypothetical protein